MKRNFISNSPDSIRMFKSDFLESLSKVHFLVPLLIFIPVIAFLSRVALFNIHMNVWTFLGWLLIGILFWTLTEYVFHRFIFHYEPTSIFGKRTHFIVHGVHHDYPNDSRRLVMPPSASVPMSCAFFFLFKVILPSGVVYAFFPGFIAGYLFYDMIHYALHHARVKHPLLIKLKRRHMLHHYSDATKGYGVSLSFWDKVFNSDFPNKQHE